MIPIGFSTYATQKVDVFDALPRIRAIGYDAIEIAIGDAWPTAPHKLNRNTRRRLAETLRDLGFPPPALFGPVSTCARDSDRQVMRAGFVRNCILAEDLNFGGNPAIITTTVSGPLTNWNTDREAVAADLMELADLAAEHHVILAVEPHVGAILDTPEKAAWLMENTGHSNLKIHFDHSHFHVQGIDLRHAADLCLPDTVHIHIKDGYMNDGTVTFLLPGEGSLDLNEYFKTLLDAGTEVPVGAEVSAMIWSRTGYDPWQAADFCYRALASAREQAIVESSTPD
ncbi:MAG: sugar phosphate isomerase/epimerase [Gemmatimonadetes bacterium]|nr:sugar phosphate isomerase/epimerase [Gemmatimonadota bacterium]